MGDHFVSQQRKADRKARRMSGYSPIKMPMQPDAAAQPMLFEQVRRLSASIASPRRLAACGLIVALTMLTFSMQPRSTTDRESGCEHEIGTPRPHRNADRRERGQRSEESRVGKECGSRCRSWCAW